MEINLTVWRKKKKQINPKVMNLLTLKCFREKCCSNSKGCFIKTTGKETIYIQRKGS